MIDGSKTSAARRPGAAASERELDEGRSRARSNAWLLAALVFALYIGFIAIGAFKSLAG